MRVSLVGVQLGKWKWGNENGYIIWTVLLMAEGQWHRHYGHSFINCLWRLSRNPPCHDCHLTALFGHGKIVDTPFIFILPFSVFPLLLPTTSLVNSFNIDLLLENGRGILIITTVNFTFNRWQLVSCLPALLFIGLLHI